MQERWRTTVTHLTTAAAWLVAWTPFGYWSAIVIHALRAWRFLGRWPFYGNPDPKDLPPFLLDERLETVIGYGVAIAGALAATYATRRIRHLRRIGLAATGMVVLWIAAFALAWVDPGGVLEWYAD